MEKFTLKSNPETYKLSNTKSNRYNKIYPYLAYALRNIYGWKTSFLLGYIFKNLHPPSSILQMLTSKMLAHDPKKQVTQFYVLVLYRMC